jgi:hypothetical protein
MAIPNYPHDESMTPLDAPYGTRGDAKTCDTTVVDVAALMRLWSDRLLGAVAGGQAADS